MKRIDKKPATAALLAALLLLAGCAVRPAGAQPTPRAALAATPLPTEAVLPAKKSLYPENRELLTERIVREEIPLSEIQRDVRAGRYSYEDLTRFCLDRINESAASNAVIAALPDAIERAKACDSHPGGGSPLYGIPVIVSDSIDVAGAPTTAGMRLLASRVPEKDAFVVEMLQVAGAIPIGKANLDELHGFVIAYGKGEHGSSLGGKPVSPYGGDTGGAEFGSAMSVAMGLAPLAVGMDTRGSLLSPACCNSVVAIRPSRALVSRTGLIPACADYDVVGPVARRVSDAAYLLWAMQGSDVEDPAQREGYAPIRNPGEFLPKDCAGALSGVRVYLGTGTDALPDEVMNALKSAGALLVSGPSYEPYLDDPAMEELSETPYRYGVVDSIDGFLLKNAVDGVTSIPSLVGYNETHAEAVPYGQDRLLSLALLPPMDYAAVETVDAYSSEHSVDSFMAENRLDLILSVDASIASLGDTPLNPSVSLPMGRAAGEGTRPLTSVVFTARENRDETAITTAYVLETLLGSRRVKP